MCETSHQNITKYIIEIYTSKYVGKVNYIFSPWNTGLNSTNRSDVSSTRTSTIGSNGVAILSRVSSTCFQFFLPSSTETPTAEVDQEFDDFHQRNDRYPDPNSQLASDLRNKLCWRDQRTFDCLMNCLANLYSEASDVLLRSRHIIAMKVFFEGADCFVFSLLTIFLNKRQIEYKCKRCLPDYIVLYPSCTVAENPYITVMALVGFSTSEV